jgi:uncharacterized membrane protein
MTDVPIQLMVAAFQDSKSADSALAALKSAAKDGAIKVQNAAVLKKDSKGKITITETADMGGKKGAAIGGVAGGAIGLIAGPALLVPAAVGALVGGLVAKMRDTGFDDARLRKVGDGLKPGSSAIIAVVEHQWVAQIEKELQKQGAEVLTEALRDDISSQLEAGHDVAYTALAAEGGFAAGRLAVGDDSADAAVIAATEEGIVAGRFVATKEGIAVEKAES